MEVTNTVEITLDNGTVIKLKDVEASQLYYKLKNIYEKYNYTPYVPYYNYTPFSLPVSYEADIVVTNKGYSL